MLLVIDVGNTEITLGWFEGEVLRRSFRVSSETRRTADEVELLLRQAFPEVGMVGSKGGVPAAVIGSVVPTQTAIFTEAARRLVENEPLLVGASTAARVRIEYRDPGSVGADRIANAVAAFARYGAPAIVVDFGTATTFDVLLKGRRYAGGVIAPGVLTGAEHLVRRAARLGAFELKAPARVVGKSTEESLQSGVFYGAVGEVDSIVRRIAAEEKIRPRVIATGGLAVAVAAHSDTIHHVDPDLTLHGLRLIFEKHGARHGRRRAETAGKRHKSKHR